MKRLVCEMCGSTDLIKRDGVFECQSCGCKYTVEEAKKMMIEGSVDVSGSTVKIDNTHLVGNYMQMAENAYSSDNNAETENYVNKILEIEPNNAKALMLKGKAAGWQSTLQNSRFAEATAAFSKAIVNASEDEKELMIEEAIGEITKLSKGLLVLRGERFAKWPDAEEQLGFITDITAIMNGVIQFVKQSGITVPPSTILGPAATIINQSVTKAFKEKIAPDYKSERYPWPDEDDFRKYIDRIDICKDLVLHAIDLCDEDDDDDIVRYENLVFLEKEAINACSYDWKYQDWSEDSFGLVRAAVIKNGGIPDISHDRYYYKQYTLNDNAVSGRKTNINAYETTIKKLKAARAQRIASEEAEKQRLAEEKTRKRLEAYWKEHIEEKTQLEEEKSNLEHQVSVLNNDLQDQITVIQKKIEAIPGLEQVDELNKSLKKLQTEKETFGLFKGKEKRALQEIIDKKEAEKKAIVKQMEALKEAYEGEITSLKQDVQSKVSAVQSRISAITKELICPKGLDSDDVKESDCEDLGFFRDSTHNDNNKRFTVELKNMGANKIHLIKTVRELTGLGLKEAKELVDTVPQAVKSGLSMEEATIIREALENAGAEAVIISE